MIELYGMSSPNVTKVLILLEELGVPYEMRHVDVFRGRTEALAGISPFGKVPAIVDRGAGGLSVFESGAILTYLAETHGGEALLPRSGPGRYAALQWLMAQVAIMGPLLGQNNHFRLLPEEAEGYGLRRYAEQSKKIYRVLDERLAVSPYLAGETYSIADIAVHPWAAYVPRHDLDWTDYPALKAWWDKIGDRPAVARAATASARFGADDVAAITQATPAELNGFFWRSGGPAADFGFRPEARDPGGD